MEQARTRSVVTYRHTRITKTEASAALRAMTGSERFLPDFRTLGATLVLSLLGELLALMLTLSEVNSPSIFWSQLGLNSLFILWVVLISQAVLAIFARNLDRMAAVSAGFCVFLVVVSSCLFMTWLDHALWRASGQLQPIQGGDLPFNLVRNSVLAGLVTTVGLRYQYVQYLMRLQARAESAARLDALQSRMRPHFLFNSLNAIASLTRRDPQLAEELTLDLSELFRAILRSDNQWVTLEEEISLCRQYLNIEQHRLGERLRVEWVLDEALGNALIPPLSLQPLIENAVYHGIEPSAKGGVLKVSCQFRGENEIILCVRNSLPADGELVERQGNRIALGNLRLRLLSFYGDQGRLMTSMVEGFYQTRMIIPYVNKGTREHSFG